MRNNAPGGIGNDLALDDITFRPCGPIITSSVQGNSDTVNICEGNTNLYTLTADASSAYTDPVYQWQVSTDTGATWTDIAGAVNNSYVRSPTGDGLYSYRAAVTERASAHIISCRIESNAVVIHVHPKPNVNAGADRILIINDSIHLDGKVTGENPDFYWGPPDYLSDIKSADPVATPTTDIAYTLFSESAFGCKNEDNMRVKVVKGIFVPSAFTPNNDGRNDRWRIPYLDPLLGASVNVYNRFGKLVYRAAGTSVDWDGTFGGEPQPSAVYIYLIRFPKGRADMKGTVTIIR
jgi:gliding motility-associated-like protein